MTFVFCFLDSSNYLFLSCSYPFICSIYVIKKILFCWPISLTSYRAILFISAVHLATILWVFRSQKYFRISIAVSPHTLSSSVKWQLMIFRLVQSISSIFSSSWSISWQYPESLSLIQRFFLQVYWKNFWWIK